MEAFQDKWPRWRQLTSTAAHRGMLCFGSNRGSKVTCTNPHRWLPGFRPDDGDAALRTLVTRYLYAYGPATPQHFARWLSIPPRRPVELFDVLAGELEHVVVDVEPGWVMTGDTATPQQPHRGICLLPYVDTFVSCVSLGSGCTQARPRPAGSARRARPATTRCCWSMAWSVGCGTSGAPVASSPSPSNRCAS
jgi:hypothetical protein